MRKTSNIKTLAVIRIIVCLAVTVTLMFTLACAPKPKVYKIGILSGQSFFLGNVEGLKVKMAELGYKENENIIYDLQQSEVDMTAYENIVKKFVADKVDLVFSYPTEASQIAKKNTDGTAIPVVFADASIEGTNLVDSIQSPGGNITGIRIPSREMVLRRFEVLMQIVPGAKRIFIPHLKGYPNIPVQSTLIKEAASSAGLAIEEAGFENPGAVAAFLDERSKQKDIGMDAIFCFAEPLSVIPAFMEPVLKFAGTHKLVISGNYIRSGDNATVVGVMIDHVEVGKQAAVLIDKILKGTTAGTIPVVTPENALTIDYLMAQKIGVTIPEGLLRQANKVIR